MKILAFDVAIAGCTVATLDTDTKAVYKNHIATERGQAEMLIPLIDEIVTQAGWRMSDIDRVAVTTGPGSFTGVRIGLSTARSLAMALDVPVFGMSTLDILCRQCEEKALVLIDTKRGDYYGQCAGQGAKIWSEEDVAGFNGPVIKDALPDIAILLQVAAEADLEEHYITSSAPSPIYLRGAEVSQPKSVSRFAKEGF